MIDTGELEVQRQLTEEFIAADSVQIALERSVRTPDGAGGYATADPVPLAEQQFRLIPQQDGATERLTADGKAVNPAYVLMGSYTADLQRWDEFELAGIRYQVVFINQNRQYEVKGEVAYLG